MKIDTQSRSPSGTAVRVWLFSLSEGLNRVRSLKLQLFCTLAGLPPIRSAPPPHLVTGGRALAFANGRLPALHALTPRTRQTDPLLKTQLLTGGREEGKEGRRRE
ncbi:hypothetical protein CgunFtcFv8_016817 [Champsocephalus gunnari]|uniref:Uncharacterized protein n=1 Tax=Champsocephalus gunnari TaxID=52237 RepID=A0AAN8CUS6_CHAGU|nr:hypothetical protein CgunFtcFv8_016817 [Champsocephalus gunnari]